MAGSVRGQVVRHPTTSRKPRFRRCSRLRRSTILRPVIATSNAHGHCLAPASAPPTFDRLLLTGAAGGLGRVLRPRLKRLCRVLRASDIAAMDPAGDGEEVVVAPLEDAGRGACAGRRRGRDRPPRRRLDRGAVRADPAGQHRRRAQPLRGGAQARRAAHRVRQLEPRHRLLPPGRGDRRPTTPMRPDGHYGLSKAFGENLSRFYFDRYGLETVCLRIGSSFPEPKDRRMLATWLSYDDLERLVVASLTAPVVGHSVDLRLLRQHDALVGQHLGGAHRLSPAGQLRAVPRRRRGAPAATRPERPDDDLPGRRLRHQGPVRELTAEEQTDDPDDRLRRLRRQPRDRGAAASIRRAARSSRCSRWRPAARSCRWR